MRRLRLILWTCFFLTAVAGVFVLLFLPGLTARNNARAQYKLAQQGVEEIQSTKFELENRLSALRTHVDSVELGARVEYRLIKPGERIELIESAPDDQAVLLP